MPDTAPPPVVIGVEAGLNYIIQQISDLRSELVALTQEQTAAITDLRDQFGQFKNMNANQIAALQAEIDRLSADDATDKATISNLTAIKDQLESNQAEFVGAISSFSREIDNLTPDEPTPTTTTTPAPQP